MRQAEHDYVSVKGYLSYLENCIYMLVHGVCLQRRGCEDSNIPNQAVSLHQDLNMNSQKQYKFSQAFSCSTGRVLMLLEFVSSVWQDGTT